MVELGRTEEAGKELAMASTSCSNKSPLPMKETSPNYIPYPPPLAKYENVVASPALFRATLEKLHASMGTKFMIPTIGGRELDLHRLFVEVTSRGGIEKIIRERRWKEVTAVFNFPSTATNASFVLRKYYGSLLQHYEQIYFFQARGWTPLPADSVHSTSLPLVKTQVPDPMLSAPEVPSASFHEPRTNFTELPGAKHASSTGSPVFGVIDGKFDSGYLVTVTIGTETLKGVLYQTQHATEHLVRQHNVYGHNNEYATATPGVHRRRRRKKSEIKRRDPNHPKPNRSGYNFFFAEQHARLKPLHPGKDREISRMIGELWNKLKDSERTTYQEKAIKDKERYRIEMEDYRERLKSGQIMSEAVPIQQRFPDPDVNMMEAEGKLGEAEDNESSSCKSGYEYDKNMDKDSDMEPSLEGVANESANVCMEGLCKEDASEMQNKTEDRGDERMENEKEKNLGDAGMEEKKEEAHDETLGYSAATM